MRAPFASDPARSRGRLFPEPESPTRTVFQRDRDRIVHSGAFRKLQFKTQVFVYDEGDYYRTRLTHSIEVAQIARSMARCLGLDEDLAEAVALAHDLGHTPFGHTGEEALAGAMAGLDWFSHNEQTVRIVTRLERRYAGFDGLNLSWEALEGIVKHNGPIHGVDPASTIGELDGAFGLELASHAGPEAQVAAIADDIAYNTHDIDDGIRAALFSLADLESVPLAAAMMGEVEQRHPGLEPRRRVHETVRGLVDRLVADVLAETRRRLETLAPPSAVEIRWSPTKTVAFSPAMEDDLQAFRNFLFNHMYRHSDVDRERAENHRIVVELFERFMQDPALLPGEWHRDAISGTPKARARTIGDYIAGMTDRYARAEHERVCGGSSPASATPRPWFRRRPPV